jgi:hypothetical protein
MKRNFSLWLAALLAVILFSCNKELAEDLVATESEQIAEARAALKTPEEVNFFDFNYLSVTNPHLHQELSFRDGEEDSLILALADRILLQNATHGFVPELVNKIGYPIWDRSNLINISTNQQQAVLIPFAKTTSSSINAFLLAVPLSSSDWFLLLADKPSLLAWLPANISSEEEAEAKEFFVLNYLIFDKYLFGTPDPYLKAWLFQYGDDFSPSENQGVSPRCTQITVTHGDCVPHVFRPEGGDDPTTTRGPCGQFETFVVSSVIIYINCGGTGGGGGDVSVNLDPFGYGSGPDGWSGVSGNNWWGGVSAGGSNCLGCPGSPWNDPAIAQQVQRCELISDIANGQIPGSLGQFSQAEIDLCNNLSTLMEQLVLSADNVKFLIENLDQLAILTAYFSSGIATLADQNAAIAFMNLRQEGKISMTLREFMALHRLVFGELGPELGLTELEMNWLLEHGEIARDIDVFLDAENRSEDAKKVVNILIDIANSTETPLTQQQFKELLDAFDLYFDDPENNAEQLFDALIEQNINPLAVDPAHARLEGEYNEYDNSSGWGDYTVSNIWEVAGPIKQDLMNRYPDDDDEIEDFFTCKVIGLAFEEAVLASLGIPKNTTYYNGRVPDGKVDDFISDNFTAYPQPFFIEVKARLGSTFDYSGTQPWAQFTAYLAYLEAHAYADNTISHGLNLILPAGVSLAQTVKDAASAKNVPLYVSYVELKNNDISQFRVKAPELVNFSNLDYSGHLIFGWSPGPVVKYFAERMKREKIGLKFQPVLIDFQKHADKFEMSHLIGFEPPNCPPD